MVWVQGVVIFLKIQHSPPQIRRLEVVGTDGREVRVGRSQDQIWGWLRHQRARRGLRGLAVVGRTVAPLASTAESPAEGRAKLKKAKIATRSFSRFRNKTGIEAYPSVFFVGLVLEVAVLMLGVKAVVPKRMVLLRDEMLLLKIVVDVRGRGEDVIVRLPTGRKLVGKCARA